MSKRLLAGGVVLLALAWVCPAQAQSGPGEPEYVSRQGVKYYAQPDDKGAVAEAEKKLAADPRNIELIFALGSAQAGIGRMREAIATYTRGLETNPNHPKLLLERGHRYVNLREFDKALGDLEPASQLTPKELGVWYHMGLARYFQDHFDQAAAVFARALELAQSEDNRVSSSDWLYMSYRRAGKSAEAVKVLERITAEMKVGAHEQFYLDRLLFYKGVKKESEVVPAGVPNDAESELRFDTVAYGVANWHFYNGNAAKAQECFRRILQGKAWAAFAFIGAEMEVSRQRTEH